MQNKESLYPLDWLDKAKEDLERVGRRIEESDLSDAAFHLQQAIEKYLKAYLLSQGWRLKKIHDLRALLEEIIEIDASFSPYLPLCREVTAYYQLERYPFFKEPPSSKELKDNLDKARELANQVEKEVKK